MLKNQNFYLAANHNIRRDTLYLKGETVLNRNREEACLYKVTRESDKGSSLNKILSGFCLNK